MKSNRGPNPIHAFYPKKKKYTIHAIGAFGLVDHTFFVVSLLLPWSLDALEISESKYYSDFLWLVSL